MNPLKTLLACGLSLALSVAAEAAKPPKRGAKVKKAQSSNELKTDVQFSDHDLHGQYQTPDEALAKVENEKGLSDLLQVRKNYKDRLKESLDQE